MTRLKRLLRRFRKSEDGSATVEFVIIFPIFMFLFASCFELGTIMLRQTMLDRGIDMTVRQVRLGVVPIVTHDTLKDMICDRAAILPNCNTQLKLEMRVIDPRAWVNMPATADCIDRADLNLPALNFQTGLPNQMMILRACHLFDPYFPTFGLGEFVPRQSGDAYALISTSSYVVEPN